MSQRKFDTGTYITPLYGLVLTGGKSVRMKTDKSLLEYHGKTQVKYCYDLLSQFCEQVFVSNRMEQSKLSEYKYFPQIHDAFQNTGPLDGMLSAMTKHPGVAWLVLACDLPFVDVGVLEKLIQNRRREKIVTVYKSNKDSQPEPLCAIYEPKSVFYLLKYFNNGYRCPRKILVELDIHLINQDHKNFLENINNPEEYRKAKDVLQKDIAV